MKTQLMPLDENVMRLSIESMDEKQIQNWASDVQQLVLFNRVCLFVAKKLKSYQESGFNIVSAVLGILMLVLYTIFTFAVINFGLFKINHSYYSFSNVPSFFNFFYYSFNVLLLNQIQEVIATTPMAQIASMVESFYSLFIVAILVALVFSIKSQKDADELNWVINHLKEEGIKIESFIKDKYKLNNIEEAMAALQKLQASFIDFLYKITETIV